MGRQRAASGGPVRHQGSARAPAGSMGQPIAASGMPVPHQGAHSGIPAGQHKSGTGQNGAAASEQHQAGPCRIREPRTARGCPRRHEGSGRAASSSPVRHQAAPERQQAAASSISQPRATSGSNVRHQGAPCGMRHRPSGTRQTSAASGSAHAAAGSAMGDAMGQLSDSAKAPPSDTQGKLGRRTRRYSHECSPLACHNTVMLRPPWVITLFSPLQRYPIVVSFPRPT